MGCVASALWLAGQVDKICGDQWSKYSCEHPEGSWSPKGTRQEQEQVGNFHRVITFADEFNGRDGERIPIRKDLLTEEV